VDGAWSTSHLPRLLTSGSKGLPDSELTGWMLNLGMKQQLLPHVQTNFTRSLSAAVMLTHELQMRHHGCSSWNSMSDDSMLK